MSWKGARYFVAYLNKAGAQPGGGRKDVGTAGRCARRGSAISLFTRKQAPGPGWDERTMRRKGVSYFFVVYSKAGTRPRVGRKDGGTAGRCARRGHVISFLT